MATIHDVLRWLVDHSPAAEAERERVLGLVDQADPAVKSPPPDVKAEETRP